MVPIYKIPFLLYSIINDISTVQPTRNAYIILTFGLDVNSTVVVGVYLGKVIKWFNFFQFEEKIKKKKKKSLDLETCVILGPSDNATNL